MRRRHYRRRRNPVNKRFKKVAKDLAKARKKLIEVSDYLLELYDETEDEGLEDAIDGIRNVLQSVPKYHPEEAQQRHDARMAQLAEARRKMEQGVSREEAYAGIKQDDDDDDGGGGSDDDDDD